MGAPDFLNLPQRQHKPRTSGLTHVLDKGLPNAELEALLASAGDHIDIWKFGWGTAYLDPELEPKIQLLEAHGVKPCLGGTLLEVSWLQGQAKECLRWAEQQGLALVEVSRGVAPMSLAEKADLIGLAAETFTVVSEVGSKDPDRQAAAGDWHREAEADIASGAWLVVAEGRESGTVGLYDKSGEVKPDIVAALVSVAGPDRILFEAPRKDQQAFFIRQFGHDVNLANISPADVLGLEALRLGLRADTVVLRGSAC